MLALRPGDQFDVMGETIRVGAEPLLDVALALAAKCGLVEGMLFLDVAYRIDLLEAAVRKALYRSFVCACDERGIEVSDLIRARLQ